MSGSLVRSSASDNRSYEQVLQPDLQKIASGVASAKRDRHDTQSKKIEGFASCSLSWIEKETSRKAQIRLRDRY